jgi:hypothetical protein
MLPNVLIAFAHKLNSYTNYSIPYQTIEFALDNFLKTYNNLGPEQRLIQMIAKTKQEIDNCVDEDLEDRLYRKLNSLNRIKIQLDSYLESVNGTLNSEEKW